MTPASKQAGLGFGLLWMTASIIGFALGATAFRYSGKLQTDATPAVIYTVVSVGLYPFVATLPGFLHWLILRRWFPHAGWWVVASKCGHARGLLRDGLGIGRCGHSRGDDLRTLRGPREHGGRWGGGRHAAMGCPTALGLACGLVVGGQQYQLGRG